MSNIKIALQALPDTESKIGFLLIDFYQTMDECKSRENSGGLQATAIVMAINDIKNLIEKNQIEEIIKDLKEIK